MAKEPFIGQNQGNSVNISQEIKNRFLKKTEESLPLILEQSDSINYAQTTNSKVSGGASSSQKKNRISRKIKIFEKKAESERIVGNGGQRFNEDDFEGFGGRVQNSEKIISEEFKNSKNESSSLDYDLRQRTEHDYSNRHNIYQNEELKKNSKNRLNFSNEISQRDYQTNHKNPQSNESSSENSNYSSEISQSSENEFSSQSSQNLKPRGYPPETLTALPPPPQSQNSLKQRLMQRIIEIEDNEKNTQNPENEPENYIPPSQTHQTHKNNPPSQFSNSEEKEKNFIASNFLKNTIKKSNFEFRMISMFYSWFCDGYEDKNNLSLNCLIDLLGNLRDPEIKIRVGSLVGILKLIFYGVLEVEERENLNRSDYSEIFLEERENLKNMNQRYKEEIIVHLLAFLSDSELNHCQYSVYIILEIFMIFGKHPLFFEKENLQVLVDVLVEHHEPEVRKKCTKLLFGLDWAGLTGILTVIGKGQFNRENEQIKQEILGYLINSPMAIETILVPSILNKFHSSCHITQTRAVVALGKLGIMGSTNESIPILRDLLTNSKINKNILCGTLRAFSDEGLRVFLEHLNLVKSDYGGYQEDWKKGVKKSKILKILSAMAYYLGCIIDPSYPGNMEIKLLTDDDESTSKIEIKRGDVCEYIGPIEPPIFTQISTEDGTETSPDPVIVSHSTETLEKIFSENQFFTIDETDKGTLFINAEDFLVVLKRLLKIRMAEVGERGNGISGGFDENEGFLSNWRSCLNKEEDFRVVCEILLKDDQEEINMRISEIKEQIQFSVKALTKLLKSKKKF